MKDSKIVAVLSLWRDSEGYIDRSLDQFEAMETLLHAHKIRCVYSFFENDSVDETPHILMDWLSTRKGIL